MGKGEIARYEQFLLFPQYFLETCTADTYKQGLLWEKVNILKVVIGFEINGVHINDKEQNANGYTPWYYN